MIGKLLGKSVRIVNSPIRAAENLMLDNMCVAQEEDRVMSKPLDDLADQLEAVDDKEED